MQFLEWEVDWIVTFRAIIGFAAFGTQSANQTLGHHTFDGAADQERLDSHVGQAHESTG